MEFDEANINNYTLEELHDKAEKINYELKRTRDELNESYKELELKQKKQKVIEIKRNFEDLAALKEELGRNRKEITLIDEKIKVMQQGSGNL